MRLRELSRGDLKLWDLRKSNHRRKRWNNIADTITAYNRQSRTCRKINIYLLLRGVILEKL